MKPAPQEMTSVEFKSATVYDTGVQLMITGPNENDVREALEMLVNEDGAKVISAPARVGAQWVAECTRPSDDGCEVRQEKWKLVVMGPSEEAVKRKVQQLTSRGALILEPPHWTGDRWAALLHEAGLRGQARVD